MNTLDKAKATLGGGIASLSAAVLLIRDAGFRGANIRILEELEVTGGALDGSGDPVKGYVTRGGRMFVDEVEKRFGDVPGVESVTVNYAAENATVRYDETLLEVADIKILVHQRGLQSAGESHPTHVSEHEPAPTSAAVPTPKAASASASTPVATVPNTSTVAAPAVPAMAVPGGDKQQDKTAPSVPSSATVAAPPKPSPVASTAKPSTPVAAAPKAAPDAKSSTPTAAEPKADSWKVHALSLTVTLSVAYILCAIFDVLFPPFGLLAALAPASPLPISGSPLAYLTGFALFTVVGFVFGALHGIAWAFWSKRLQ